jgi:hypothetical protein
MSRFPRCSDCGPIGGGSDYPTNVSLKFSARLHAQERTAGAGFPQ